ncbi:hypothetical protein ABPG72_015195 [Tetrahymena utriculariae]
MLDKVKPNSENQFLLLCIEQSGTNGNTNIPYNQHNLYKFGGSWALNKRINSVGYTVFKKQNTIQNYQRTFIKLQSISQIDFSNQSIVYDYKYSQVSIKGPNSILNRCFLQLLLNTYFLEISTNKQGYKISTLPYNVQKLVLILIFIKNQFSVVQKFDSELKSEDIYEKCKEIISFISNVQKFIYKMFFSNVNYRQQQLSTSFISKSTFIVCRQVYCSQQQARLPSQHKHQLFQRYLFDQHSVQKSLNFSHLLHFQSQFLQDSVYESKY